MATGHKARTVDFYRCLNPNASEQHAACSDFAPILENFTAIIYYSKILRNPLRIATDTAASSILPSVSPTPIS